MTNAMENDRDNLSVTLLKEKVCCPLCKRRMALRTLKFKHVCKNPVSKAEVEARRAKLLADATQALEVRMSLTSCPSNPEART